MPKYAHKYIRQRELGKKVTRPLKAAREYVRQSGSSYFKYKMYIDSLNDQFDRVYQRYQLHRRAMPTDFRAINNMRHSMNEISSELNDLGESKRYW